MSSGRDLLDALKGVRRFFGDLGKLLTASDAIMGEQGWEVSGDATALFWTSASVSKAPHWVPQVAFRNYVCAESFPRTLTCVSILIDDCELEYQLREPVVSGAYFVYLDDLAPEQCWLARWNACWCGYRDVPLDGSS